MKIQVKFVPPLQHFTGGCKDDVIELPEGTNIGDALAFLIEKYGRKLKEYIIDPKTKEVRPYIQVMVNAKNISSLNGSKTKLKEGDLVRIFPPISGG